MILYNDQVEVIWYLISNLLAPQENVSSIKLENSSRLYFCIWLMDEGIGYGGQAWIKPHHHND